MIDLLMGKAAVVLQDVVLVGTGGQNELLRYGLEDMVSESVNLYVHGRYLTRSSDRCSSGISASFSPWYFGITSCPGAKTED